MKDGNPPTPLSSQEGGERISLEDLCDEFGLGPCIDTIRDMYVLSESVDFAKLNKVLVLMLLQNGETIMARSVKDYQALSNTVSMFSSAIEFRNTVREVMRQGNVNPL